MYLQVVVWLFSLGITAQLLILLLVAIGQIGAQTTTSKIIFAVWFAAAQPFILLNMSPLHFPWLLVLLAGPLGYIIAYLGISLALWFINMRRSERG
ncbi:hypothetical protein [Candidatus Viadribacter manganicus]|nr:hypothetical protein [Candidatus Viadribacter manganicus]